MCTWSPGTAQPRPPRCCRQQHGLDQLAIAAAEAATPVGTTQPVAEIDLLAPPAFTPWCPSRRLALLGNPDTIRDMRMLLCPTCGNKRCPHAHDHRNACTGSNDVGQPLVHLPEWQAPVRETQLDAGRQRLCTGRPKVSQKCPTPTPNQTHFPPKRRKPPK